MQVTHSEDTGHASAAGFGNHKLSPSMRGPGAASLEPRPVRANAGFVDEDNEDTWAGFYALDARTSARMPALMASDRCDHATTTAASSGSVGECAAFCAASVTKYCFSWRFCGSSIPIHSRCSFGAAVKPGFVVAGCEFIQAGRHIGKEKHPRVRICRTRGRRNYFRLVSRFQMPLLRTVRDRVWRRSASCRPCCARVRLCPLQTEQAARLSRERVPELIRVPAVFLLLGDQLFSLFDRYRVVHADTVSSSPGASGAGGKSARSQARSTACR